jgi:hypothetical protein
MRDHTFKLIDGISAYPPILIEKNIKNNVSIKANHGYNLIYYYLKGVNVKNL